MNTTIDTTDLVNKIIELRNIKETIEELKETGFQMAQRESNLSNEIEYLTQQAHSALLDSFHQNVNSIIDSLDDDKDNENDDDCSCCCCGN